MGGDQRQTTAERLNKQKFERLVIVRWKAYRQIQKNHYWHNTDAKHNTASVASNVATAAVVVESKYGNPPNPSNTDVKHGTAVVPVATVTATASMTTPTKEEVESKYGNPSNTIAGQNDVRCAKIVQANPSHASSYALARRYSGAYLRRRNRFLYRVYEIVTKKPRSVPWNQKSGPDKIKFRQNARNHSDELLNFAEALFLEQPDEQLRKQQLLADMRENDYYGPTLHIRSGYVGK